MKITPRRARWLGRFGAWFIRLLGATWRTRRTGVALPLPEDPRFIFACLHGDMLLPAFLYRKFPAVILISRHGDGEVIAQAMRHLNKSAVRGSSTRGGARALLEMMQKYDDQPWVITPDGPKGPRGHVHEGAITLAAVTGRPIYPVGFAVSRGKRLGSWDRFVIPAPFCRVGHHVGAPLSVHPDPTPDQRKELARELGRRLAEAGLEAGAALASG